MYFDVPVPCFFGGQDFCEALRKIKACGFDAVETYDWKGLDRPRVKAVLDELQMQLVSICTSEFRLTDAAYRDAFLAGVEESIAAAKELGVTKMITQVGPDTGAPRDLQHRNIVVTLRMAAPLLEKSGITLMIEPLNALYDHKGYFLTTSAEAADIVKEVHSENVKIIFDIYHQQATEGNILNNIQAYLPWIAHIHAAGHPGRHELQEGENDYRLIFDRLQKMGYEGAVGLEYGPLMPPEESLAAFRRIYL